MGYYGPQTTHLYLMQHLAETLVWGRTWDKNVDKLLSKKKIQKIYWNVWVGVGGVNIWYNPPDWNLAAPTNQQKPRRLTYVNQRWVNNHTVQYVWENAADESHGCQHVWNMKSHIYEYTPSSLTNGFSHAPQTNSSPRFLHDIIPQTIKCFRRFFPQQWPLLFSRISFSRHG